MLCLSEDDVRKPSAYNLFLKDKMSQGMTIVDAVKAWKEKEGGMGSSSSTETQDWQKPSQEDQKILDITHQLCQQLNIIDYNPSGVTWKYHVQRARSKYGPIMGVLPWDQCVLGTDTIVLADSMRGRLEPDEWRPIITSALFYRKKLRTRILIGIALRALIPISVTGSLFVLLPILLPQPTAWVDRYGNRGTAPLGLLIMRSSVPLWLLFIGLSTGVLALFYRKKMRLLADRDAADLVGAPVFLAVLTKIQGLDSNDYGKTKNRRGAGVNNIPTLEQRIIDLQDYSGQGPMQGQA